MRVYNLAKNKIKEVVELMDSQLGTRPSRKLKDVKVVEIDEASRVVIDREFKVAQIETTVVPFLADAKALGALPAVVVDPGAVKFICNGADVMRPGVVRVEGDFEKGSKVAIKESAHGKTIAVGEALLSSIEVRESTKGAMVKNIHYVGDRLWEGFKQANL